MNFDCFEMEPWQVWVALQWLNLAAAWMSVVRFDSPARWSGRCRGHLREGGLPAPELNKMPAWLYWVDKIHGVFIGTPAP